MTPTTVTNTWPARLAKAKADALQAKEARLQRAWQAHRDVKARAARPQPVTAEQVWMTSDGLPPVAWREVDRLARRLDVHTFYYVHAGEKMFSATVRPGAYYYTDNAEHALQCVRSAAKSRGAE